MEITYKRCIICKSETMHILDIEIPSLKQFILSKWAKINRVNKINIIYPSNSRNNESSETDSKLFSYYVSLSRCSELNSLLLKIIKKDVLFSITNTV